MRRRIGRGFQGLLGRRGRAEACARLPFDPDDLERRLLWIFGLPGTPTAWLLQALCRPLRMDASKPLGFEVDDPSTAVEALPVEDFHVTTHIAPMLGVPVERGGRLVPATLNNYLGIKPAYAFARGYRDVWAPAMRRLILVRAHALQVLAAREGVALVEPRRVLITEPGAYATDLIMSLFPRSRLLCLVRDGRDTVAMDVERGPRRDDGERLESVASTARDWACTADAIAHGFRSHPRRLRRMVRFEELMADPAACVASIRAWLGFTAPDLAPPPMPERSVANGCGQLSDAEREAVGDVMGSRLTALGYDS
jgi:hypothetical protein